MSVVQAFLSLFTAFGLSASVGLNACIPLLVIALVDCLTEAKGQGNEGEKSKAQAKRKGGPEARGHNGSLG